MPTRRFAHQAPPATEVYLAPPEAVLGVAMLRRATRLLRVAERLRTRPYRDPRLLGRRAARVVAWVAELCADARAAHDAMHDHWVGPEGPGAGLTCELLNAVVATAHRAEDYTAPFTD